MTAAVERWNLAYPGLRRHWLDRGAAVLRAATPTNAGLAQERLGDRDIRSSGHEPATFLVENKQEMTSRKCHVPRTWP